MKKRIISLILSFVLTGAIFADDIPSGIRDYIESIIPGDAVIINVYPKTLEAERKLHQFRLGDHNKIVDERIIGPSKNYIPSSMIDAYKIHTLSSLAASIYSYVRGEALATVYNEDMASTIATKISSTVVYAEILRNSREELRFTYTFKTADGSTGYGVSLWLATSDKSLLDEEIQKSVNMISSR